MLKASTSARAGEIKNFTGIDSPYEAPKDPEITIDTVNNTPEAAADEIVRWMEAKSLLDA
jgi:bifunctional enzyme CysN/CysC